MAERSFADAVAKAKADQDIDQPVDAYDELEKAGFATMADAEDIAGIFEERALEQQVDRFLRMDEAHRTQPQPPAPMNEQSAIPLLITQNQQLMQANQQLQQQVMELTMRLSEISAQLAAGGGMSHAPQQKRIKRADTMSEAEQWQAMHGEGGLLG